MSTGGVGGGALVAIFAILPLVVLMLTSFVKVSVVIALLRNAIGAPDAPSGLVVMGMSLVLTFFVMAPVAIDMVRAAAAAGTPDSPAAPAAPDPPGSASPPPRDQPGATGGSAGPSGAGGGAGSGAGSSSPAPLVALDLDTAVRQLVPPQYRPQVDAARRALEPLRGFLARHAAPRDRDTFVGIAHRMGREATGDELWVLAPAFLTTELREAFAIAVLVFIPFLVIDLIVGLGLAALGLQATQPHTVALPLKLLLFVSVDGWRLLIDSLLRGYV